LENGIRNFGGKPDDGGRRRFDLPHSEGWPMKRLGFLFCLLLSFSSADAADPWHQGELHYKHDLMPVVRGQLPADLAIALDDGTTVEVEQLAGDDILRELVRNWSTERVDYRATPPSVDRFLFRVKGFDAKTGLRKIEIRYQPHPVYGRRWIGITHVIR
jgi:hypothetical protein